MNGEKDNQAGEDRRNKNGQQSHFESDSGVPAQDDLYPMTVKQKEALIERIYKAYF